MIKVGTKVKWKVGNGYGAGEVEEMFSRSVTKIIKDSKMTREGTDKNKVLLVKEEDGSQTLLLENEVEKVD